MAKHLDPIPQVEKTNVPNIAPPAQKDFKQLEFWRVQAKFLEVFHRDMFYVFETYSQALFSLGCE